MTKKVGKSEEVPAAKLVGLLADVESADTVYADVYRRRGREKLEALLSQAEYDRLKGLRGEIDLTLAQAKAATMREDWGQVASLAQRVEELRGSAEQKEALVELGSKVYDAPCGGIDPFSPGFGSLPGFVQDLAELRNSVVGKFSTLAEADPAMAQFYGARRDFFSGLALASKQAGPQVAHRDSAEIAQLAAQAAHSGDVGELKRLAQELVVRRREEKESSGAKAEKKETLSSAAYRCPVDLAVLFSDDVVNRARALGFVMAQTQPTPQAEPLFDYAVGQIWRADFSDTEAEREGMMRAEALLEEAGFPPDVATPIRNLVGQFLRNPFINSGGARYIPRFSVETLLIEDFPEDQEPPATGELLSALGFGRRRALSRQEIDEALLQHGAAILEERLKLDPKEFRLVCLPHDLYMRFGRDRGWGQQEQWTHFDGYQVLRNGHRRALVGGSARYGGLGDLVSIATNDQREGVIARFAVIRRARQVARWR